MAKRICVTAGHGGTDCGAINGHWVEAALAVVLRNRVAEVLASKGISVLTDGTGNQNLPLSEAIKLAKSVDGPKVEFHFNAGPQAANGVEALSLPSQRLLALDLAAAVAVATGQVLRGEKGWKPENAGQHSRLGFCEAGGVILEIAFITHQASMEKYLQVMPQVAIAIADVLAKHAA